MWTAALAVALLVVSSCGDSGGSAKPTTTASGATTTAGAVTSTPPTSVAPTSAAPTSAAATDEAQVRSVFLAFFNGADRNIDKKVAALQDGERYRQMLVDADADSRFQQLRADVRAVRFPNATECTAAGLTSPCAIVTFDLLLGAFPALAGHDGPAVQIAGVWKVGAKAWCDVVAIGGDTCPS